MQVKRGVNEQLRKQRLDRDNNSEEVVSGGGLLTNSVSESGYFLRSVAASSLESLGSTHTPSKLPHKNNIDGDNSKNRETIKLGATPSNIASNFNSHGQKFNKFSPFVGRLPTNTVTASSAGNRSSSPGIGSSSAAATSALELPEMFTDHSSPFALPKGPVPKAETMYLHMNGTITEQAVEPPVVRYRSPSAVNRRQTVTPLTADRRPTSHRIVPLSQAISAAKHDQETLEKDLFMYNSDIPKKSFRYSFELRITGQPTSGIDHSPISSPPGSPLNKSAVLATAMGTASSVFPTTGRSLKTTSSMTASTTRDDDKGNETSHLEPIVTRRALTVTPRASSRQ
jgi:hypothetical protein